MDSALQTDLENIRFDNYPPLVIVTAITYDYILTFSSEIEYIWNQPWTPVSTLFIIIRYVGLCSFVLDSFLGSSFLPGSTKFCVVLAIISQWTFFVYICAADIVMILRLWAMYDRSKTVLGILLTSYLVEIIPSTISSIVYSNPNSFVVAVNQILDLSFCSLGASGSWYNSDGLYKASILCQLVHAGVMCTLVIIQFKNRSVEMYRATERWQLGPLIQLLVMQGMAYFLAILMWNLVLVLCNFNILSVSMAAQSVPLLAVEYVPISTLTPRFIMNIRETYACGIYDGRGHDDGIDTWFGLAALSTGRGGSRSPIILTTDGGEREGFGHDKEDVYYTDAKETESEIILHCYSPTTNNV